MNWRKRNFTLLNAALRQFCGTQNYLIGLAGGKLIFRSLHGKWLDFRDIGRRERYALQSLGEGEFFYLFLNKLDSGWEFIARETMEVKGFLARAENIINSLTLIQ